MKRLSDEEYEALQKRMNDAFELVKPTPHWKGEILAIIPESEFDRVDEAVSYFTGSHLEVLQRFADGRVKVYAAGYWLTIGS